MDRQESYSIALAGNPNSGKSTLFNVLTGARQHIGNYPGVTVEKKEGAFRTDSAEFNVIDLPGAYGLSPNSPEEVVARDELVGGALDLVVDVVDASNLERNLYFTVQLLEMDVPMVIALNMVDAARGMGIRIDCDKLSALLGVPVVETVGHRSEGLDQLKDAIVDACTKPTQAGFSWMGNRGDSHFRQCVKKIVAVLESEGGAVEGVPVEWTAVKLLEKDRTIRSALPEKSLARID
ncbi:MAG: 50S ribosome-binding GTPase, partial [Lentisphaeria bacterium]|nr:50S ribosome-binding GTPase [Lentisphaeria bacterium]